MRTQEDKLKQGENRRGGIFKLNKTLNTNSGAGGKGATEDEMAGWHH